MKIHVLPGCLFAAALLLTTSCSDFLDEDPKGRTTTNNFFQSQKELDLAVNSLYHFVEAYQCNSNPTIFDCQGDDCTSTTGSNKAAYLSADAFETPTDVKGARDRWNTLYSIIRTANTIINVAANVESDTKAESLGQAYYWRAYAYFKLVRSFGELPLITENVPDNNETKLSTVEEVYAQIVKDLQDAEACNLPAKYTATYKSIDGTNLFISAQTVKATLAAVYLNMAGYPLNKTEYFAQAAAKAKEVIDGVNNGTYPHALLSDWNDVYNFGLNHHSETLLGIDYQDKYGDWNSYDSQFTSCHALQSVGGWGDFVAERKYWKDYPEGPRKDAVYAKTIHTTLGNDVNWWATTDGKKYDGTNAVLKEYHPMFIGFSLNKGDDGSPIKAAFDCTKPIWTGMCAPKRHQLIRYSEVICWYAEAAARAGQDLSLAKSEMKKVLDRAYSDPTKVSAILAKTGTDFADAVFNEHGYEVAGNVYSMCTRRDDEFRLNILKQHYDYRKGEQTTVLVPAGTLTYSEDANGKPFTYTTTEDVVVKEQMSVTASWNGENSIYHIYPPTEVEKNPNLNTSWRK